MGDGLLLHTVHRFCFVLLYGKCFPTRRGSCIIGNLPMGRRCGGQLGDDFKDNRAVLVPLPVVSETAFVC